MFSPEIMNWVVIPTLIFLARLIDVPISTVRVMFIGRGLRNTATLLGFFEVLIWLIAISQIFQNLNNWLCYVTYAAGFAAGTYIGMLIENKLAVGNVIIRIISNNPFQVLISELSVRGFGYTYLPAQGSQGPANLIFMVIRRKRLNEIIQLIKTNMPDAFYTIEDIQYVSEIFSGSGIYQTASRPSSFRLLNFLRRRK
ncbi:MAG: DUF2179 domain-containing protein [Chitinophagales bacterium]|jgi:uncharacterized protein YebE (UPF0316 family)|nr:DUF2179 domain-containing protein [Sphingobacteriales bacterium]MBP9141807.1 DUF2179 domain-containing protein [Chitinophagales bacterium]MDA0198189.1 DUF2179 domain-containing protein [Bacteroidota bacterium]MBK6889514.1 DUF2179 domain-containing protein [Sphingobacteriales bacterium]MBL0246291.1 DUF2179 domain-containing protein [Sphingobacteriales bacterium]